MNYKNITKVLLTAVVLPLIVSWGYDWYNEVKREPVFFISPLISTILKGDLIKNKPLTIVDKFGRTISGDVNIVTFYLYNRGNEPVRKADILKPLKIEFSRKNRLLDFRTIKSSRDECKIAIGAYDSINNTWDVNFDILEKNDGFSAQVIYAGDKDNGLKLTGTVVGVSSFELTQVDLNTFNLVILVFLSTLTALIGVFIIAMFIWKRDLFYKPFLFRGKAVTMATGAFFIIVFFIYLRFVIFQYQDFKRGTIKIENMRIPESIQ